MLRVETSAGPIEYVDSGGSGPVLVMTHGLTMNGSLWRRVTPHLGDYRVLLPTLPLGSHRLPMHADADLSQRGQARLLGEFLDILDLSDVTLIMNDWGGAQFVLSEPHGQRVGRLVMVACEAFDNFPPRPARPLVRLCAVPGGVWLLTRLMGTSVFRHHPLFFGGLSSRGLDDSLLDEWFAPARGSREIRRDLAKFAAGSPDAISLLA